MTASGANSSTTWSKRPLSPLALYRATRSRIDSRAISSSMSTRPFVAGRRRASGVELAGGAGDELVDADAVGQAEHEGDRVAERGRVAGQRTGREHREVVGRHLAVDHEALEREALGLEHARQDQAGVDAAGR